jgi:hypothetical protein
VGSCRWTPLLHERGLTEPVFETDLAELCVVGRNQRALAEFGPEVPRVRVDDNLARIVAPAEALMDQLIETELLGPATSTGPFSGAPTAILPTALATSSAATG